MNWISVKDKLPKEHTYSEALLIYDPEDDYVYIGDYVEGYGFGDFENSGIKYDNITHWIYLKDIPKPSNKIILVNLDTAEETEWLGNQKDLDEFLIKYPRIRVLLKGHT